MLGRLFGKKNRALKSLPFKSPEAALEYSCRFMDCEIEIGKYLPAIVKSVERFNTGEFAVRLKIPSSKGELDYLSVTDIRSVEYRDGGTITVTDDTLPGNLGLTSGAMVGIYFAAHQPEFPYPQCWLGFVVGTIEPTWDMQTGWQMTAQFNVKS